MMKVNNQSNTLKVALMTSLIFQACNPPSNSANNQTLTPLRTPSDPMDQGTQADAGSEVSHEGNQNHNSEQATPSYTMAPCLVSNSGPYLPENRSESDDTYLDRFANLEINSIPNFYDLSVLDPFTLSLIRYMLDEPDLIELTIEQLISYGIMGRAVLLALANPDNPNGIDIRELRRGLYHFYNCSRQFPATLNDFKSVYGNFENWDSTLYENSFPKIYPRRLKHDSENGIYIAETLRNGQVHETEIIISGSRKDGNLDFLSYAPNGQISSTGEFRAGSSFTVGASPYTCLTCHLSDDANAYNVIFPDLTLDRMDQSNDGETNNNNDTNNNSGSDSNNDSSNDSNNDSSNDSNNDSRYDNINLDSESDCGLQVRAEVRDQQGLCSECRSGDYITLAAVLFNSCTDTPKIYESNQNCLVSEFAVLNQRSMSSSIYPMTCGVSNFRLELMPGERYEETRPAGRLSNANYSLTIQLEDNDRNNLSIEFSVE